MKKIDKIDNQKLEYALTYAYFGFPVFPVHSPTNDGGCSCGKLNCKSIGKHPITKNGFKDATTDEQQIRKWWDEWPNANIGMPMGRETGLFALDIDEGGEDELKKHPQLPHSIQSRTGSGGRHIFFFIPRHKEIKNRTRFLPGLDIRGEDGYVVVPPSIHESGEMYKWRFDANIAEFDPDECSNWLLEEIEKSKNKVSKRKDLNLPVSNERIEEQVKHIVEQITEGEIVIG
jgi:putative DNA primase/helicase